MSLIIDDKLIDRLSQLAKLQFNGEEKLEIKEDLENILNFMGKLEEVDTDGVEPLIHLNTEKNVLRADIVEPSISKTEILKNAPNKDSDYFKLPKVLNK